MNESEPETGNLTGSLFAAFYDVANELFVVDFTGLLPFAESSDEVRAASMFTHGISTDGAKYADGTGYMAFNKIALTEKHLTSDFLPEAIQNGLSHAASKLVRMYEGAPKEWVGCKGQMRCEKAAQLINENKEQMVADLVASYSEQNGSERA